MSTKQLGSNMLEAKGSIHIKRYLMLRESSSLKLKSTTTKTGDIVYNYISSKVNVTHLQTYPHLKWICHAKLSISNQYWKSYTKLCDIRLH